MGRRLPRRVWHTVAALVPLPLIGLGYVAAVPGNPVAFQVELLLSGKGSAYAVKRTADAVPSALPREASYLFRTGGKGPRADQVLEANAVTYAGKQLITASLGGDPGAGPLSISSEISRTLKGDRLNPTVSNVALKGPVGGSAGLLMNASYGLPFAQSLDVDGFKPSPSEIAYHPSADGLNFRSKGESQAEFEERERRCLATAIYFEARGEPVRGQIAVGQVIMNRVRSPMFPETICGVVYQGQMHPGCQFSFACDGRTDTPRNDDQWALAQSLSKKITNGDLWLPEVGYSTYYHANYVSPAWVGEMSKIDKIGRHIFYKKTHEEPYVVEASTTDSDSSGVSLTPTLSLVSAAVSNVAGTSTPSTPAMSLGYAAHE
ncbi:MAG: cell wall hydrolase [Actinomycetota bacterium]|jgi:spore germination cell wall hydrolase CwlJ-like protein